MAHKKGVGSTDNGRDSKSKRLGVKLFGGQHALAGNIIVRQRGTRFHAGENVYMSKDFSLHAAVDGTIQFRRRQKNRMFVSVVPAGEEVLTAPAPPKAKPAAPKAVPVAAAPAVEEAPVQKAEAPAVEDPKQAAPAGKVELPSGKKIKTDDLKVIEGIGPKIEGLLHDAGIKTWADLANASEETVQQVLDDAGPRYRMHSPATWSKQAQLCVEEKWQELEAYQDELKGGREE